MFKSKKIKIGIGIAVIMLIISLLIGRYLSGLKDKPIYISDIENISDIEFKDESTENTSIIGFLKIESLNIDEAPIAEGTSMDILNSYIGHFEETPYINGNIALCGHNRGYDKNYFENLKNIKLGALIEYTTKNETFIYKVVEIKKISETDMSILEQNNKSCLTLITCVENQPQYRYCIIAEKVEGK